MKKFNAAEIVELNLNQTQNGDIDCQIEFTYDKWSYSWCTGLKHEHYSGGPHNDTEDNGRGEVKNSGI